MERAGVAPALTAAEFNAQIQQMSGLQLQPPLTDAQLEAVRERMTALQKEWSATPPGSSLDLDFDRS